MWEINEDEKGVKVYIGREEVGSYEKVTAEDIKRMARDNDISKFVVTHYYKENGEIKQKALSATDFPIQKGIIVIFSYDEAG